MSKKDGKIECIFKHDKFWIFTLLLLSLIAILAIVLPYIKIIEECESIKFSKDKRIAIYLAVLLVILSIMFFIFNEKYNEKIKKFIKPFFKSGLEIFIFIIMLIVAICILSIFIHSYSSKNVELTFFNLASFILCLFSIFLTSRVYLKLEKEKTNTLEEYLERLIHIITHSGKNDKIFIIAPTIILGQAKKNENYIYEEYFKKLLNFLNNGEITFVLLDGDLKKFDKIEIVTPQDYLRISHTDRINSVNYKLNGNDNLKKTLFNYHIETWKLYTKTVNKDSKDDINEIEVFFNLLNDKLSKLKKTNAKFIDLSPEFYLEKNNEGYDYTKSNGFFAIANFKEGLYYLGNFNHNDMKHDFQGTYFENKHIEKHMRRMLRGIIEKYCLNLIEDIENCENIDIFKKEIENKFKSSQECLKNKLEKIEALESKLKDIYDSATFN